MLYTEVVAQAAHGKSGAYEVSELALVIQPGGIPNHMIVDVRTVGVRIYKKSVAPLREPHRQLIPDSVCLLRRYLARLEALAGVVGDNIVLSLIPPGDVGILFLCQKELGIGALRRTLE